MLKFTSGFCLGSGLVALVIFSTEAKPTIEHSVASPDRAAICDLETRVRAAETTARQAATDNATLLMHRAIQDGAIRELRMLLGLRRWPNLPTVEVAPGDLIPPQVDIPIPVRP